MILDSSVIIAVILRESGWEELVDRIFAVDAVGVGTPTLCECSIVLRSRVGPEAERMLDEFLEEFQVSEIPFGPDHWRAAAEAFARFGKGRHPAGLNFGDCLNYAVAKLAGAPLLYVGNDFARTDFA